jgi:outer membrane murein-binding lipoprotein Lpp
MPAKRRKSVNRQGNGSRWPLSGVLVPSYRRTDQWLDVFLQNRRPDCSSALNKVLDSARTWLRHSHMRFTSTVVISLIFLSGCSKREDIEALNERISSLERRQSEIDSMRSDLDRLADQVLNARSQLVDLAGSVDTTVSDVSFKVRKQGYETERLTSEVASLREELETMDAKLRRMRLKTDGY